MFSRKSGLVPGFTTILKCTPECDDIVALHIDGKVERRCSHIYHMYIIIRGNV